MIHESELEFQEKRLVYLQSERERIRASNPKLIAEYETVMSAIANQIMNVDTCKRALKLQAKHVEEKKQ